MLVELRLENYAVIDNLVVEFASGLNLLTGETGAGKSILIDALTLLLGEKASTDVIRSGAERAVISAVFEIEAAAAKTVAKILEENGLDSESDSVILRREIASGGRGRVFVNNQPATVAVLKQLGPYLSTVHAQNETLAAFDGPARLACSMRSPDRKLSAFKKLHAVERNSEPGSRSLRGTNRIVCACWTCGLIRSAKLRTPETQAGRRRAAGETRSAYSPTPKKSITRR